MDKIWLKSYPDSVPHEIDCTQYRSVTHLLEESFQKYADRNAFVCMDKFLTYRELDKLSLHMGAWLQSKGLSPGARVAIMLPNVLQYPVAMAAILRAGYTVVNVNPLYTPRELEHQLTDSGSEAIIVLENFATTVEQVLPRTQVKHVIVATMGDLLGGLKGTIVNFVVRKIKKMVPAFSLPGAIGFNKMLAEGARLTLKPVQQGHDDIVFLQYTGGTTGVSKGAMLLHRVGGFAPLGCHEDVDLVKKFESKGYVIIWSNRVRVMTSGRLQARASEGFAAFLANLEKGNLQ